MRMPFKPPTHAPSLVEWRRLCPVAFVPLMPWLRTSSPDYLSVHSFERGQKLWGLLAVVPGIQLPTCSIEVDNILHVHESLKFYVSTA